MATTATPLYNLTKKGTEFVWNKHCQIIFDKFKQEITSDKVLVPYDPQLPIARITDASPVGCGAVLSHIYQDGSERPVQYIHKKFDKTVFISTIQCLIKKLIVLNGSPKTTPICTGTQIYTDNGPPSTVAHSKRKKLPPLTASRLLHYALFLHEFTFDI